MYKAENQINDLEDKEEKKNLSEQQEEKKNPKKRGYYKEPLGQLHVYQHLNHRGARRRGKSKKLKTYLKK